jgi:hypothetical protein
VSIEHRPDHFGRRTSHKLHRIASADLCRHRSDRNLLMSINFACDRDGDSREPPHAGQS